MIVFDFEAIYICGIRSRISSDPEWNFFTIDFSMLVIYICDRNFFWRVGLKAFRKLKKIFSDRKTWSWIFFSPIVNFFTSFKLKKFTIEPKKFTIRFFGRKNFFKFSKGLYLPSKKNSDRKYKLPTSKNRS